MNQEDIKKALEAISKGGINVAGDLVLEKKVEYEVNNVENGGIGIQILNGSKTDDEEQDNEIHDLVGLTFFDQVEFGSEEKQPKLIVSLNEATQMIDTTDGRSWFCIYAGYRYYKSQLAVSGGYVDFFTDIEALMPDKLTKINKDKQGDERYNHYTTLMGREAKLWYMDEGKLPPLHEMTTWKNRFNGDKSRFAKNAKIIIDVIKKLRAI